MQNQDRNEIKKIIRSAEHSIFRLPKAVRYAALYGARVDEDSLKLIPGRERVALNRRWTSALYMETFQGMPEQYQELLRILNKVRTDPKYPDKYLDKDEESRIHEAGIPKKVEQELKYIFLKSLLEDL